MGKIFQVLVTNIIGHLAIFSIHKSWEKVLHNMLFDNGVKSMVEMISVKSSKPFVKFTKMNVKTFKKIYII